MVVVVREYFHAQKYGVMRWISNAFVYAIVVVVGNG